ncbi:hypothetical protein BLNAU_10572 [Blattamonas nauphoetae]|uniref:Uncharacterized protein n=1 Tax=Blattamonas nauphoetae TaxID=2049346 RepID=A0ABQ9XRP6_9EUKA|nr:hypothetical protein BLNAU_10572 [Blattamonas nauphoetae]
MASLACLLFHIITMVLMHASEAGNHQSLNTLLDEFSRTSFQQNSMANEIIHLPKGILSTHGSSLNSVTLSLEGLNTQIHFSRPSTDATNSASDAENDDSDTAGLPTLFKIRNSTICLACLSLMCDEWDERVATVSSSCLTVSNSEIHSNGANSPFVMLGGMFDGQSQYVGSSLHVSKCRHISSSLPSLMPLVELSHQSRQPANSCASWMNVEETSFVEEMSISASDLSIRDSCLTFGTGPLIGFGGWTDETKDDGKPADQPWKVSSLLSKSEIVNTTSNPSNWIVCEGELFRMELTQRVTDSRVHLSTNHLYGTACVDMNAMGSLLSLNTSFTSCLTDTPTHLNQYYTATQRPTQSAFFKLCTFKGCSASNNGGALSVGYVMDTVRVEDCSFKTCSCTSTVGGAICDRMSSQTIFTITSSSFVSCSTAQGGGSIHLFGALSASLDSCVFFDSKGARMGGAVHFENWNQVSTIPSITNCHFENCRTTGTTSTDDLSGGAIYLLTAGDFRLHFLTFRGNTASQNPGNDIMFGTSKSLVSSKTILGCTSTSASYRLLVYSHSATNDYLPNPTTVTHVSCVGTVIDSNTAEFTLKMTEIVTGTVLVLIDNTGGSRYPTGVQAPNIGRVLSFSLDNSIESKCSVSLGESGLVQTPLTAYQVIKSSFVGSFVLSASCALDTNKENALITISGRSIPSGTLSVTLSESVVLDFTFTPNHATSEVLTVPLTGTTPKLGFGKTYVIYSAQSKTQSTNPITVPYAIEIDIPRIPYLSTLKTPVYDEKQKTVNIDLEGVDLDGTYKVTLSVNGTATVTIDVVFSSSKGQFGGILFDTETPTKVNMSYNTLYQIVGMKQGEGKVLCLGDLSFTTMAEPTRLVMMECEFDKAKKNALIQISGRALDTTSTYKVGLSISGSLKHTATMTFNSSSELWEGSALLYPSSSAELEYGKTYSVSSLQKGDSTTELFFEANSIEMTPEPPRLVKVESIDAVGLNLTTLTLSSLALTDGAKYTLELKGTPLDSSSNSAHVVPLSFTSTSQPTHSFPLSLYPTEDADLKYGHSYSVDWMKTGDIPTIIETDACSFSTPIFPERLVNLSCDGEFSDAKKKTITVTFESLGLKPLTEYSIVLKSTATDEVLSHTKSLKLKTNTNGLLASHTAVLFPVKTVADELEGQLEFGLTYTVDGFKRGVDPLLYDTEHITLTTPPEPARLTKIDCTGSTDKEKKVTLSVTGRKMTPDETYTLALKVKDKTSNSQLTVDVRFTTDESGTGSAVLFSTTSSEIELDYDTTYEVTGVTDSASSPILFEDGLTFTTIVEPTRLVTMECGYDEEKKNALIRMTGQVLDSKKEYEIELSDSDSVKKTIEMTFNTKSSKWEGSAILYSQSESVELEYGMTYSVSEFKTKGETSPHPHEDLTITIDDEPSRIEGVSYVLDGKKTKMIVSLSGRELKSGMGKIGVCGGNSKWISETEIVSGSDGKWKAEFLVGFSESSTVLEYGSTYTLCGLDGSVFFVNDGISITVPQPPVVSSLIPELNTSTHSSFRVVLSGSDLPTTSSGSFTASFSESAGTFVVSLSESSEWRSDWIVVSTTSAFEFNKTYTLTSLIDSSSGTADHLLCSGVTLKTPLGPTLTGLGGVSLTGASLDCVSIVLNVARIVADTFVVSVFDVDDASKELIPLSISFSSCDATEGVMTHSVSWESALQYGHRYEIASMSSSNMEVSIPSQRVFDVPVLSSFGNVLLTHNSINTFIRLQLSGNGFIGKYTVTLTSGFSFVITAESDTSVVSDQIAIGWSDSLAFDTPFTIQSIVSTIPDSVVLLTNALTFTTPKKPDPLVLHVDGRTGETSRFCGELSRPCSCVEVAWEIVCAIGVWMPTVGIVHSATLGCPIHISNGMVALLSNLGNVEPTLRIPLSACESVESGMIVVSSSTLEIRDVDIVIDSLSPSFVLLFGSNSNLTLKEGSFVGPQSTPSSNDDYSDEICSWTSGILQLDNSTTSISDTKLNHLSFGAVNMKNGFLKVESSSFHDNSPSLPSFTSLRRNIICSDDGLIEIGSLNGGDGTGDDRSAWIAGESCILSGKESITSSSFFVPSLIPKSCRSSYTSKTKTFAITIVGSTLIPCGLRLEVFEKLKDGREGQPRSFELNVNSSTSFSENEIVLSLSESSLPTFSKSLEWRGRLVFGNDVHTSDWFVIQANSSDRFAQAMKDNMKWRIPVVVVVCVLLIVLIVIVIVCIRRRRQKEGNEQQPLSEMEEQIEVKIDEDGFGGMVGEGSTRPVRAHSIEMDQSFGPPTKSGYSSRGGNGEDEKELGVTVIGTSEGVAETRTLQKYETLYDRLHTTEREVNKKGMMQSIVCGLQNAARMNSTPQLSACLASHWVLIDPSERT